MEIQSSQELWEKGAQIDMIISRDDRIINICEMKFAVGEYRITDNYEETLRNRMSIFQAQTKSNKTLVTTFVTTFGVADGLHRSIVGRTRLKRKPIKEKRSKREK